MATLDLSVPGELWLVLSGAGEQAILTTLRRWPHWVRAKVERDPVDATRCVSVTLVTDPGQEATLREILRRSFGLTFAPEGGSIALPPRPAPVPRRRGFDARRS